MSNTFSTLLSMKEKREKDGRERLIHTLNKSSINVPLPGPNSIIRTLLTCPCASHSVRNHIPINSPKICDTSGDVTKSPRNPNWSCVDD
jgi:hypothetical protein